GEEAAGPVRREFVDGFLERHNRSTAKFQLFQERRIDCEARDLIGRIVAEIKIGEFGDFARSEDDDLSRLQSRRLVCGRERDGATVAAQQENDWRTTGELESPCRPAAQRRVPTARYAPSE